MGRGWAAAAAVFAVVAFTATAHASTRLVVGFDDNALLTDPVPIVLAARDLGAKALRIPVHWQGEPSLAAADAYPLDNAIQTASGFRIVLVLSTLNPALAPQTETQRQLFCDWARSILQRYPVVKDVIIWNEPNKTYWWAPQFNPDGSSAAPAAYEALLATCYDVLHALRPNLNMLAFATTPDGNDNPLSPTNISHSPGNFIRKVGEAYRASGRTAPIFDAIAHHAYPLVPGERPWRHHTTTPRISEGDWDKLMLAFHDAFDGTHQRIPGQCANYRCMKIWYTEMWFQTTIDPSKASFYTATENSTPIPADAGGEPDSPPPSETSMAPDQRTQIVDAVRLAVCQPYVGAFFNYLVRDERDLRNWQSGPLWADGTKKPSYDAFKQAFSEARPGGVDCKQLKGGLPPRPDTTPPPPPTALTATLIPGGVSLDWPDVSGNDIQGFNVLRQTGGGAYQRVNPDLIFKSAFKDMKVENGRTYSYEIRTFDSAELGSTPSLAVTVTVGGPTAASTASFSAATERDGVRLSWRTENEQGMLGFHVYRIRGGHVTRLNRELIAARGNLGGSTYALVDRGATRRKTTYRLQAVRWDGTTSWLAAGTVP